MIRLASNVKNVSYLNGLEDVDNCTFYGDAEEGLVFRVDDLAGGGGGERDVVVLYRLHMRGGGHIICVEQITETLNHLFKH